MSIDTANTVIIAGWYPDPTDDTQARWWDGSQWTSETRPRHPATPHQGNRYFSPVPIRTDATLPPIDPYRPLNRRHDTQGFVSMGVKATVQFHPTRAYTGSVWAIATMPLWVTIVVLGLAIGLGNLYSSFLIVMTSVIVFVIAIALAIHDHKVMLNSLHPAAASAWWMLLSPLVYLIVRGVHVSRTVGHGWAPLVVYLICSFVPAVAVLAFSWLFVFFASMLGAM
ncbi:uncharacterized membrane protein YhaH (DUF805 family) [Cryobacterium mesophilum]|uniref:DUF2510 domain-containing protein n=1 Tax=Terrimesophilobacter mesophilus TaxID=433647 RepID=A0A4R8V7R1_9MICO|nr:DUF2510 domain-containing protein [Terrimesophilobacter mesophilus]MBB5634097.1 uncharacterized membrane protein YhaH (DUF805 family) [Terrimesophilobacter mesophilus]TFB78683.1 DUF2510 domain-containing protein [Terrimesophilobacter mesophilus]